MKYCTSGMECGFATEDNRCTNHLYCNDQVPEITYRRMRNEYFGEDIEFDFSSINKEIIEQFWNDISRNDSLNREQFEKVSRVLLHSQRSACVREFLREKTILNGNNRDIIIAIQDAEITKEDIPDGM